MPSADIQPPCHFPPAYLSDFVIYYRNTAYHVHKFILCCHSAYFRSYVEQLTDGQRAYPLDECDQHPTVAHCMRLPDSCGKMEANSNDLRLFVCHLHFAEQYSCIPYKAASEVDLAGQPPPAVSLTRPVLTDSEELDDATSSRLDTFDASKTNESVMSLCHYFDCAVLLSRAEHNMPLVLEELKDLSDQRSERNKLLTFFLFAVKFDLQQVKKECMARLATSCTKVGSRHRAEWDSLRQQLDKNTLFAMMQAALDVATQLQRRLTTSAKSSGKK